jgi:hypothetical protein
LQSDLANRCGSGRRVGQLLEQLETLPVAQLQILRAVEVLEHIGTPAAKALLERLVTGADIMTDEVADRWKQYESGDAVL